MIPLKAKILIYSLYIVSALANIAIIFWTYPSLVSLFNAGVSGFLLQGLYKFYKECKEVKEG